MCFSPAASFAASIVLGGVGVATLHQARAKGEILLAIVPLFFALQQFVEGMIWLSLLHYHWPQIQNWLIIGYGIFAGMIWPVYMPLTLLLLEPSCRRKQIMIPIVFVGICVTFYVLVRMLETTVTARIADTCILYEYPHRPMDEWLLPFYFIAACAGFFASSRVKIHRLGIANIVAFLGAYLFYDTYLVSVWCFFAAVISVLIYFYFRPAPKLMSRGT